MVPGFRSPMVLLCLLRNRIHIGCRESSLAWIGIIAAMPFLTLITRPRGLYVGRPVPVDVACGRPTTGESLSVADS